MRIKVQEKREWQFDLLRIIAISAVILVHCSGVVKLDPDAYVQRNVLTFLTAVITWEVPVFVMISGRFFLDPERQVSGKKIRNAIKRLVIAFVVWDIVYQLYYCLAGVYSDLNWKGIICQTLIGPYHFWFLYMLICLYAIVPFLRKITAEKQLMEYFIFLFFVFELLIGYGPAMPYLGETLDSILGSMDFHFALGFAGYYVLGYYLCRYRPSARVETGLYICGILCLIFAGLATVRISGQAGIDSEWYIKYLRPNIIIEAAAIYTFFVHRVGSCRLSGSAIRIIGKLSEYSFGVYLVHALINEFVSRIRIPVLDTTILGVPAALTVIFLVSNILVAGIRRVPYVGKKIT